MEITKEAFLERAKKLYGTNPNEWKFKCPNCERVQSCDSVREQMKQGIKSQRYGILKKGDSLNVESACFSPDCNWVANGLFRSGVLVVIDPEKSYSSNVLDNCTYIFPLVDDSEMNKQK